MCLFTHVCSIPSFFIVITKAIASALKTIFNILSPFYLECMNSFIKHKIEFWHPLFAYTSNQCYICTTIPWETKTCYSSFRTAALSESVAWTKSICSTQPNSLPWAYIHSQIPNTVSPFIGSTDCFCHIGVPANIEVQVS